jgi:hypothetical protein
MGDGRWAMATRDVAGCCAHLDERDRQTHSVRAVRCAGIAVDDRRRRRVDLGATPKHVAASVAARGVALSAIGLAIGLTVSIWGTRIIQKTLYGVSNTDPSSYIATAAVLLLISIAACLLPMARALAVDPVIALRGD